MKAFDNKFLIVKEGVILTEIIEPVIISMEEYFKEANKISYVTSGFRNSMDQLNTIRKYLTTNKLDGLYPKAMSCKLTDKIEFEGKTIYAWQNGWSKLLNIGILISPPLPAEVTMDYFVKGVNQKGKLKPQTSHAKKTAFDVGGASNGIDDELAIFNKAIKKVKEIKNIVVERKNNCLHLNCQII